MSEFGDFLEDQFREFGAVSVRRLFGGHGVFYAGVMIGLVAREQLYLKTDAETVERFTELDLPQFGYGKGDKRVGMSYYLAPEEALDDPSEMREWAELAYQAALRSKR